MDFEKPIVYMCTCNQVMATSKTFLRITTRFLATLVFENSRVIQSGQSFNGLTRLAYGLD